MAEEIIIRCTHCGHEIGRIAYIPGTQRIGCSNCGKRTEVRIDSKGNIETYKA